MDQNVVDLDWMDTQKHLHFLQTMCGNYSSVSHLRLLTQQFIPPKIAQLAQNAVFAVRAKAKATESVGLRGVSSCSCTK